MKKLLVISLAMMLLSTLSFSKGNPNKENLKTNIFGLESMEVNSVSSDYVACEVMDDFFNSATSSDATGHCYGYADSEMDGSNTVFSYAETTTDGDRGMDPADYISVTLWMGTNSSFNEATNVGIVMTYLTVYNWGICGCTAEHTVIINSVTYQCTTNN